MHEHSANPNMLSVHGEALERDIVAYHKFLLAYKAHALVVYGFVEGEEDTGFYRTIINHLLPDGWSVDIIMAGNKAKVMSTVGTFDWSRFERQRICFFVDRDLSDLMDAAFPDTTNLHVTDGYSIENDVLTFDTLADILQDVLNVRQASEKEWRNIRQLYERNMVEFLRVMAPIMAQILIWHRSGTRPCLDNIEPKTFLQFQDGELRVKAGFEDRGALIRHISACVRSDPSLSAKVDEAEREFCNRRGCEKLVRGKYFVWFFVTFASHLHREIPKFCKAYSEPPRAKLTLGVETCMVMVGPRARVPSSLRDFLNRNYGEYIRACSG